MQVHSKRNDGCWGFLEHRLHAEGRCKKHAPWPASMSKWPRPSLATGEAQHDSIVPPLIHKAVAPVVFRFPITHISGVVPCWTTAAMIAGTAIRAKMLPWPPVPSLVFADAGG
jgi:hypothetical protein